MQLESGIKARGARIEMLPLIDIVFLLLVVFIYTFLSMSAHSVLDVKLPETAASKAPEPKALVLTVQKNGELILGERAILKEELLAAVQQERVKSDLPLVISGDREVELGLALELLGMLRDAGVERLSFQVKEKRQ